MKTKQKWVSEQYPSRSAMLKATWADPEVRKKRIEGRSNEMKAWWADPRNRKMMVEKRKAQGKRSTFRKAVSSGMEHKWADPEYHGKMMEVRKEQANRPEVLKKNSIRARTLWKDKDYRKAQMKTRHKTMYGPDWRAKVSASCKGRPAWNKGLTKDDHPGLMKMSIAQQGRIPDYNKYRSWYPNEKKRKIRMRSRWEVGYALYLDSKNIKWLYEPQYFNVGKGKWTGICYIPDFYLPETRWFVEVKGREGYGWKAKYKEFQKRYPKIRLKVLHSEELKRKGVLDIHGCAVYDRKAA